MLPSSLTHENLEHKNIFVVNWCLSNVCNFTCSYCPDSLHNHSNPFPSLESVIHFSKKLIQQYPSKNFYFEFTGGEVTLWKDLPQLLEFLKSQNAKTGIISNGSRALGYWEKFSHLFDHVCLSFHSEHANRELFVATAKLLRDRTTVHANIMMKPENFDLCLSVAKEIAELGDISVALQPLIVDFGEVLYYYTPLQLEILNSEQTKLNSSIQYSRQQFNYRGTMQLNYPNETSEKLAAHEIISQGKNKWKGWDCMIGIEQLVIDMDGSVKKGWCNVGGAIGKITDESFYFPKEPQLCDKEFCHCNLDIMCTKFNNQDKALKPAPRAWWKLSPG